MAIDAGVMTVMVNSGEVNGEAVHGSKRLLTDLLRNRLGFEGVILTDIKDIYKMVHEHKVAQDEKEATFMAIDAGIDMSMACNMYEFIGIMKELVKEEKLTEDRINASVARIIKLKKDLGLFENPYPGKRLNRIGEQAHKDAAVDAARQTIVLLKNDSLLPLEAKNKKILLAGFAANSKKMLNGAWTFEWLGAEEPFQPKEMETIYTAMQKTFGESNIMLADSAASDNPAKLKQMAGKSDIVVLTIGEKPYSEFKGNDDNIDLPKNQQKMIEVAMATGKPVVLVMIAGRPRLITKYADKVQAILFAGHPGQGGGIALADILSGKVNPSAKLSFTYPRNNGHITPYYHKVSDRSTALYPFGHGLSYTQFTYSAITLKDSLIDSRNKKITASVTVTNSGSKAGKETVLWFVQDEVGTLSRPEFGLLQQVHKVELQPGDSQEFTFTIEPSKHLEFPDRDGNLLLENGYFKVKVGGQEAGFKFEIPSV